MTRNKNTPRDVAVNNDLGLVYVVDSMNFRIQVFDTDGHFKFAFGEQGQGASQFYGWNGPHGIAVGQNTYDVYVAATGSHKVVTFDQNGNLFFTKECSEV